MGGERKFTYFIKSFDEMLIWSIALIILLLLTIIGELAVPLINTFIKDHNSAIIITILFIFLRLMYLYQENVKNLIKKKFKEKTRVIFHRDDYYKLTYDAIRKAPEGCDVFVTNFENINIDYDLKRFDSIGYKYEKKLMKLWDKRVLEGDFKVQQIVGIWSKHQMDEVVDRIKKFENIGNYSLSVIIGEIIPTGIASSFVIQNDLTLLEFPADPTNPYMSNQALISEDPEVIKLSKKYFDVLWSNSELVKGSDGKKNDKIKEISTYVEKKEIFSSLSENYCKIYTDKKPHIGMQRIADNVVNDCSCIIESIRKGSVSFSAEEFEKLVIITTNTLNNIKCTSYLQNINFWSGEYGKKIMEIDKILIKKGIQISRIFILNNDEIRDPIIKKIMQDQLEIGINVMLIHENSIPHTYLIDFSIHDNDIVFEQSINKNGLLMGNKVTAHKRDIDYFSDIFKNIAIKAQPFDSLKIDFDTIV